MDSPVPSVTKIQEEDRLTCVLDESIFSCPPGYTQIGNGNYFIYAIANISMVDFFFLIWSCNSIICMGWFPGADSRRQFSMEEEDDLLQFAIQQSLMEAGTEKEEVKI